MDYKNLYANKYIYNVYESSDRKIHVEKHPIIYMNSEYVYYKQSRKNTLSMELICNLKTYKDLEKYSDYTRWYNKFFINVKEKDLQELVYDLNAQTEEVVKHEDELKAMTRLDKAKIEYEKALMEYNAILKLKEQSKEKKDGNS